MERSRRPHLTVITVTRALVVASALAAIGCAHGASVGVPAAGAVALLGRGVLHGEGIGAPCLPTRAALAAVRARLRAPDDAIPLAPRLRVRVLVRAAAGRDVRLRVLDGPWAGTSCWVDGTLTDLFAGG